MSVLSYDEGALFVVRVIKHLSTNPSDKWANSYEFRSTIAGSTDELLALAQTVLGFEASLHFSLVRFDEVLLSTWEPDSKPYDPTTFISLPVTASGLLGGGLEILSLDQVMIVTRQPVSGRKGHLFYRGCLAEEDIAASAGKRVLVTQDDKQELLEGALSPSGMDDALGISPAGPFGMVMVGKTAADVRPVLGLVVSGATSLPTDHAWFNRTKPTP